jgi:hypothetical protein
VLLNRQAFKHAKNLIQSGKYIVESNWRRDQPTPDEENWFVVKQGWDAYSNWHLGLDPNMKPHRKGHYTFPFGDFQNVHRAAVIAIRQHAAKNSYHLIEVAAGDLLELIDEREMEEA